MKDIALARTLAASSTVTTRPEEWPQIKPLLLRLAADIDRLKAELLVRDSCWLPEKDAHIDRLNKELAECRKREALTREALSEWKDGKNDVETIFKIFATVCVKEPDEDTIPKWAYK